MPDIVEQIATTLAELLETYANLRGEYIRPGEPPMPHEAELRAEIAGLLLAAWLIRNRNDPTAGLGIPTREWARWTARRDELTTRLRELETATNRAAQPIGYVSGHRDGDGNWWVSCDGPPFATLVEALDDVQNAAAATGVDWRALATYDETGAPYRA